MSINKKRLVSVGAIILVAIIGLTSILNRTSETAYAQQSFNGLETIITSHTEMGKPFTILEVVPDHKLAKLGYLVSGSEPFLHELASMDGGTVARKNYMSKMRERLETSGYIGDRKPLEGIDSEHNGELFYQESYVPHDGWQKLELKEEKMVPAEQTTGYAMVPVNDQSGSYSFMANYIAVDGGNGQYKENAVCYDALNNRKKYYTIKFKMADSTALDESKVYYTIKSYTAITPDNFDYCSSFKYIYKSTDTSSEVAVTSLLEAVETESVTVEQVQLQQYGAVLFSYAEDITDTTKIYYEIEEMEFSSSADGEYAAVIADADEEYVYVGETGGNFEAKNPGYRFVETGGNYNLEEISTNDTLGSPLYVDFFYYNLGIHNNNHLTKYVFHQDNPIDSDTVFDVKVIAVTPEELNSVNISDIDLLYLSNSTSLHYDAWTSYDELTNDIDDMRANEIFQYVVGEKELPIIIDSSLLGTQNTAKVYKLADQLADTVKSTENQALNHYVSQRVYVVPDDSISYSFILDFDKDLINQSNATSIEFLEKARELGFGEIAEVIVTENIYRGIENNAHKNETDWKDYDLYDQSISKSTAIEYILTYSSKREQKPKESLRILEIEPCAMGPVEQDKLDSEQKKVLARRDKLLEAVENAGVSNIEIVTMTSAEFISKVDDLSEYDMLFLGLATNTMNRSNGRTVYNDADMNGLVYTNIGDIQYNEEFTGALLTDEMQYVRYSGNDLTSEKVREIEQFAKSGSPVILDDDFINADGNVCDFIVDEQGNFIVDEQDEKINGYIDNCSRMYELVDRIKAYDNVMTITEAIGTDTNGVNTRFELFKRYLMLDKPSVEFKNLIRKAGQRYVEMYDNIIRIDFSISNYSTADVNANFDCILYADYNADGRYSENTERLKATEFKIRRGDFIQPVKEKTENNETVYYYELLPDVTYSLEYQISDDYVGIVPIKLKVAQNSNKYRYDTDIAYFYHPNTSNKNLVIKVLQLLPINKKAYTDERAIFDMENDSNNGSMFSKLLSELRETYKIDLQIESVDVDKFDIKNINDYDMLVLGYADAYQLHSYQKKYSLSLIKPDELEMKYEKTFSKIREFIKSGKSVLFTHDTTDYASLISTKHWFWGEAYHYENEWGVFLNPLLCPYVGLNRYGIYSSELLAVGMNNINKEPENQYDLSNHTDLKKALEKTMNKYGKDDALSQKIDTIIKKGHITEKELYELIVKEAEYDSKDIAYKPNSNKTILLNSVQGRSNFIIDKDANYFKDGKEGYKSSANDAYDKTNIRTTCVELLNEGQILLYPFNVLDEIKNNEGILDVAPTHGQYFQIDMNEDADNDGESDITVWLSLTDSLTDDNYTNIYDITKRDARNNYYIYTKGNVTYSGVGDHYSNYKGYGEKYKNELKLYINTMIAAYSAGAHAPTVTFKQEAVGDIDLNTVYVGIDYEIYESQDDKSLAYVDNPNDSERVYYTVNDTNIIRGGSKSHYVEFYQIASDTPTEGEGYQEMQINGDIVRARKLDNSYFDTSAVWDSTQGNYTVQNGATYWFDLKYNVLGSDDRTEIAVAATTEIEKNGTKTQYTNYDSFYVQRISLFNLD